MASSVPGGTPASATMVESPARSSGENALPRQSCEPGPSVQALDPMKYLVPLYPSESLRYVRNVPFTSGALSTIVRSRVVDCWKRYQSAPLVTPRGSSSNASAGFRNRKTLRNVPGNGRDASRVIRVGDVSLGS